MMRAVQFVLAGSLSLGTVFFGGCETVPQGIQQARIEMSQRIVAEPAGDYFIGRRYYKPDYKFWGYIRRPGQPWSTAELVMLNEKQKLAPDRERLDFGSDNNTNTSCMAISAATRSMNLQATAFIRNLF